VKKLTLVLILIAISMASSCAKSEKVSQVKVDTNITPDRKNLCFDGSFTETKAIINYKAYGDVTVKVLDEIGKKWHYLLNLGADASMKVENGFVYVKIIHPGTDHWAIQLLQLPFKIQEGKTYRVSFDAKALEPRSIISRVSKVGGDWKAYSTSIKIDIDKKIKNYSYSFKMIYSTDELARLEFNLGNNPADVWIGNIKLEEFGEEENSISR